MLIVYHACVWIATNTIVGRNDWCILLVLVDGLDPEGIYRFIFVIMIKESIESNIGTSRTV